MQEEDIKRIQKDLNPAQQAELKFLRREVDRCQDARFVKEPLPNANQNYWAAAEELDRELDAWWTKPNDALRVVFFPEDAERIHVGPAASGTYTDFSPINLENLGDSIRFSEKDFFRICSNLGCDVGRITSLDHDLGRIYRDSNSVWNEPFDSSVSYGADPTSSAGPTFIQKVDIRFHRRKHCHQRSSVSLRNPTDPSYWDAMTR